MQKDKTFTVSLSTAETRGQISFFLDVLRFVAWSIRKSEKRVVSLITRQIETYQTRFDMICGESDTPPLMVVATVDQKRKWLEEISTRGVLFQLGQQGEHSTAAALRSVFERYAEIFLS